MINDETKRKLRELNFSEVIEAVEDQASNNEYLHLTFDERLQFLVDYVFQKKFTNKIEKLIKKAKFRFPRADIISISYVNRDIEGPLIRELATCLFLDSATNIVCQGFTGTGKTFLVCALGKQACKKGIRSFYIRVPDLLIALDEARIKQNGVTKLLNKMAKFELLILDEWLLNDLSLEEEHFIFELIERRHEKASTIFCTQYKKCDWHERLGGQIRADAIMDRIVHNSVWVNMGTVNMREREAKQRISKM